MNSILLLLWSIDAVTVAKNKYYIIFSRVLIKSFESLFSEDFEENAELTKWKCVVFFKIIYRMPYWNTVPVLSQKAPSSSPMIVPTKWRQYEIRERCDLFTATRGKWECHVTHLISWSHEFSWGINFLRSKSNASKQWVSSQWCPRVVEIGSSR